MPFLRLTHNLGGTPLTFEEVESEGKASLPDKAKRMDINSFSAFVDGKVKKHHTSQQLSGLKPVPSADSKRSFQVLAAKAEQPPVVGAKTQGNGKGVSNPAEEQLLQQSGGDPLFKGVDRSQLRSR